MFTLANGDLVLLFGPSDAGVGLTTTLAQLFAPDAPDPSLLLSRWVLPAEIAALFAFLDALPVIAAPVPAQEPDAGLAAVLALSDSTTESRVRDLLERETGVLMALSGPTRLVPLFREIRFSLSALEARAAVASHVTADPFVFRHFVAKLGRVMLQAVVADLQQHDSVVAWARGGKPMLHLEMSVEAALSPALDGLIEAAAAAGARVAVEIPLVDACAEVDAFMTARDRLREAGFSVVIDQVTHHALRFFRPAVLEPDLLKLDWSPLMPQFGDDLTGAIEAFGPARIILQGADTEEAIRWGIMLGIRRFQGRHVDAILAASRMGTCPGAQRCSMRDCIEREAAATPAGRAGCTNLALLDAGAPSQSRFE